MPNLAEPESRRSVKNYKSQNTNHKQIPNYNVRLPLTSKCQGPAYPRLPVGQGETVMIKTSLSWCDPPYGMGQGLLALLNISWYFIGLYKKCNF